MRVKASGEGGGVVLLNGCGTCGASQSWLVGNLVRELVFMVFQAPQLQA